MMVYQRRKPEHGRFDPGGTIPAVVINANNILGLSLIRSLARRDIPLIAVFGKNNKFRSTNQIVTYSRYIRHRYLFDEAQYERNLVNILLHIGTRTTEKPVLFPVSDRDMILISANRDALKAHYRLILPPHRMLETLLYKEQFYSFAMERGISIPQTLIPSETSEINDIALQVRYPCIIKPSWRTQAWNNMFGSRKVVKISTPEELIHTFNQIYMTYNKLTIQKFVQGAESNIVCTFTFLDRDSEPLCMFSCRKHRQYPVDFGNTALAESIPNGEAAGQTYSICKDLKLVGYVSIEFKWDNADQQYKVLEITPARLNRQAGLADIAGVNIPAIWYNYLCGKRSMEPIKVRTGYRWISEINDLRALPKYLRRRQFTLLQWIRSYRNVKGWEILARDDLKPMLMLLPLMLKQIWISKRKQDPEFGKVSDQ